MAPDNRQYLFVRPLDRWVVTGFFTVIRKRGTLTGTVWNGGRRGYSHEEGD
jgi:hypothetical protein